jgi:flagellar motor switch protein FliN/FliY
MEDNEVKNDVDTSTEPQPEDIQQEDSPSLDQADAESADEQEITEPSMKELEPSADDHVEEPPVDGESDDSGEVNKVSAMEFEQLPKIPQPKTPHNIDMLLDVTLPISIELGRTSMPIQDILNLGPGSVVELSKLAGEPVDLLVNNKMIARGEVVVVDENFGIRVTSMVSQEERIKSLA